MTFFRLAEIFQIMVSQKFPDLPPRIVSHCLLLRLPGSAVGGDGEGQATGGVLGGGGHGGDVGDDNKHQES